MWIRVQKIELLLHQVQLFGVQGRLLKGRKSVVDQDVNPSEVEKLESFLEKESDLPVKKVSNLENCWTVSKTSQKNLDQMERRWKQKKLKAVHLSPVQNGRMEKVT